MNLWQQSAERAGRSWWTLGSAAVQGTRASRRWRPVCSCAWRLRTAMRSTTTPTSTSAGYIRTSATWRRPSPRPDIHSTCSSASATKVRSTSVAICRLYCGFREPTSSGGAVVQRVRHLGLRSVGRGFKSCSRQRCVTTLGKLFTPVCLCHQAV